MLTALGLVLLFLIAVALIRSFSGSPLGCLIALLLMVGVFLLVNGGA